ncbi:MAG: glycerol-3-phosphate acyltransferase [Chlamydiae bacterium CG10_big_fil_rev_8_21_14_0_10_42_34]|nr:MAG: glycerol-3-phosphate acyltransferase [Chlamydiae bacterium CG10_big_fil_rev_8_21_14_0_10_42_34]
MVKKLKPKGLPEKHTKILEEFYRCYHEATGSGEEMLKLFTQLLHQQIKHPYTFEPYHKKVREPFDYYKFSLDFIRPLVDLPHSKVLGNEILNEIDQQLRRGENVVLLANHQTEADPQVLGVLLEKTHPHIGEKIIYVAGERVVTDPLTIPFSMGCDLLCIYSKRYIDQPPELKGKKMLHNKNTMELMSRLLKEGGKIIYVAPSGGRDRRNTQGVVEVAPFDPPSIEMFYLMAKKAKTPTHFYPLSLATYDILPPPETIQTELGEKRIAKRCPLSIAFAPEFDMEKFPGSEDNDKGARRKARAVAIWKIVNANYERIK